jgi:hypothetical protein
VTEQQQCFPATTADGSFKVAACFEGPIEAVEAVQAAVTKSIQTRTDQDGADIENVFASRPSVDRDDDTILVIFEGKLDPSRWKDWMLAVTHDVDDALHNVQFSGFYDLVAGRPHHP